MLQATESQRAIKDLRESLDTLIAQQKEDAQKFVVLREEVAHEKLKMKEQARASFEGDYVSDCAASACRPGTAIGLVAMICFRILLRCYKRRKDSTSNLFVKHTNYRRKTPRYLGLVIQQHICIRCFYITDLC